MRASAGSGKTYELTSSFIAHLLSGEDPSGMLATTFTRAAAGEILHRVLGRLSAGVLDEGSLSELRTAVNDPDLSHEQCDHVLTLLVHQLHRLSIMTIDSFFSRMASSFSLELGLPMSYRLIEDDEEESLREESVDQAIHECSSSEMVEFLRSLQGERVQMQTHSAIMKAVGYGYAMYMATNADATIWNTIEPVGHQMSTADLDIALTEVERASIPTSKSTGKPNGHWANAKSKCIGTIRTCSWADMLGGGLGGVVLKGILTGDTPTYHRLDITADLFESLKPIVEHARYVLSQEHINRTQAVFTLMSRFDHAYRAAKMSSGRLSYEDPPRLLNEAGVTGELEHLYYRLDASIRHVMLDEFQDTSMPQFNLIEPIIDELLSQESEGRSVFVVGDIKQSLYTWRQAEPKLLGALTNRWEVFGEKSLSKSWRSSPVILDAVNAVFGDLQSNDAMNSKEVGALAATNWDTDYETHEAAKEELPGYVSLSVADGDEEDESDDTQRVLWSCAGRVAEARAQSPDASIAILVRQGKHIYPLLGMLKKLGIDACEDRGNPLVDAPSVAAAVSMLELIDHPSNSAALYHVRSTPLGNIVGLDNPNRVGSVTSDLRRQISLQGCVPVLTQWLKATAHSMDQRGFTRFTQLIELAGQLQDNGRPGAATLAMVAQSRKIDEPGHAPVRIITIHRSKGLEFDVVVMPLLGQSWQIRPDTILSKRDVPLGPITRVTRYPSEVMRAVHPDLKDIYDQSMIGQINEELCCLYVAMTRAKVSLQMVVPSDREGLSGDPVGKYSLKPAHFIRAALSPDLAASPGATLYELASDQGWPEGIQTENTQTNAPPPIPVTLRIKAPQRLRAGQLMAAAPSSEHNTTEVSAASLLCNPDFGQTARDYGECVHAAFEQFDWLGTKPDDAELYDLLTRTGHDPDTIKEALKELNRAVESGPIQEIFDLQRWITNHPDSNSMPPCVHHERPFAVRMGKPGKERLVQGRFDRLVVGRDGTRVINAQIIDYKTDRGARGLEASKLAEFAMKHQPQMNAYRTAAASMYGLEETAIEIALIFTAAPGVVYL